MRTGCEGALEIDRKDVAEVPASPPRIIGVLAKGRLGLEAHVAGKRLTQRQRIHAKCYDCMGGYRDGKVDCQCPNCPLYALMPYREKA
jgi:hypothetical protein